MINVSSWCQYIDAKMHGFNAASEMAWAWNSSENIILFGPGGYGKSVAAELFAKYLQEIGELETSPYSLSFGLGMSEEKLLGGLDIKKFQDEGTLEYLLYNAFVNSEFVIFEELWDANPQVLLILKDILTSKKVRMGTKSFTIKTKFIVACTNRSRDEVVSDASTEALMQRFVFEKEVVWSSHSQGDYIKAFSLVAGENKYNRIVAQVCAKSCNDNYKVSPRTAVKALNAVKLNETIEVLGGFYGFDKAVFEIKEQMQQMQEKFFLNQALNNLILIKENFKSKSMILQLESLKLIVDTYYKVLNKKIADMNIELKREILEKFEYHIVKASSNLIEKVETHSDWVKEILLCIINDLKEDTYKEKIQNLNSTLKKVKFKKIKNYEALPTS